MITENLSTLKIHKLTQEQYERELAAGRIDENAIYLTPDEEVNLSEYATKTYVNESEANALNSAKTYANSLAKNYATSAQGEKADTAIQPEQLPTALKNPQSLSIGSKTYDGSVAITVNASDLGLSNALHFIGTVTSLPSDATNGDVVLLGSKEYVYSNGWVELGDGDSHALKSVTISAGSGLTGGGDLTSNRVISHANTSSVSDITANGRKYITGLTFDEFGHVTGATTGTETVTDTNTTYDLAASKNSTNGNVKMNLTASGSGSGTDSIAIKGAGAATVTTDANGVITISSTNTTYTLSSFGINATAAELNYTDGVTSNIQTQLNAKMNNNAEINGGTW